MCYRLGDKSLSSETKDWFEKELKLAIELLRDRDDDAIAKKFMFYPITDDKRKTQWITHQEYLDLE